MMNMTGTTGSTFTPFVETVAGRVGYRSLSGGAFRIRVEPAEGVTLPLAGWTQPDSNQNRYSKVVDGPLALGVTLGVAVNTLLVFASTNSIQ